MSPKTSVEFREQGNQAFKEGNFKLAVDRYTDAIEVLQQETLNDEIKNDLTKCFSNRAQCHINLQEYEDAIDDATRALEFTGADQKSLYRRATAFERLGKLSEAISDAQRLMIIAPKDGSKNEETNALLRKLRELAQNKFTQENQVSTKVKSMFEKLLDKSEKFETCLNNLLVLSREDAGAEAILNFDKDLKLLKELLLSADRTSILGIVRILSSCVKNSYKRAELVYKKLTLKPIGRCFSMNDSEIVTNSSIFINNLLMSICDLENRRKIKKPINVPFNFDNFVTEFINNVFRMLADLIDDRNCAGVGRDACLDLVVKFVDRAAGCNWTGKFIITGVPKLLRVGSTVPELPDPDKKQYPLTSETRMHISCVLSVIYHDLCSDREREEFNNECLEFVKALRERDDVQARVRTISLLSVILQGPFDTGNAILGSQNLVETMIQMAGSGQALQEKIAMEAIVLSSSKKDKASGILSMGSEILKDLYQSSNDDIRVLALVGLSKLASSKGTDTSTGLVTEGSCQTLARACSKFLTTSPKFDNRRWAADGLAYLTLDADVKEELVEDQAALRSLFALCQSQDQNVLYSITTIFVNITNTYETKKAEKEMAELAKYAKQHVPKEHPKDDQEFVDERRKKLVDAGVIPVLVQICKHKSENCREQIARIFLGLCENEKYRGPIVAAGGAKALLPLTLDGTPTGKTKATQSLAKIAITTNPENSFPGQRMLEVVRPILQLLKSEGVALENFEALMALTNLASIGETVRKRILKEGGFMSIEHYMYDDHPMLRRAATECICNMVNQEEIKHYYLGENDRIKLLVLLCGEDDEPLIKAAEGTLAILSRLEIDLEEIQEDQLDEEEKKRLKTYLDENRTIAEKIVQVKSFVEIFKHLVASPNMDIQFRALYIVRNLVRVNKQIATQIVESQLMDIFFAIKEMKDDRVANEKNRELVAQVVEICLNYGLIKANRDRVIEEEDENNDEDDDDESP